MDRDYPVRSRVRTHGVICSTQDGRLYASAQVRLGQNGRDAEVTELAGFERYDAEGEVIERPALADVDRDELSELREDAVLRYYDQTEPGGDLDADDLWREAV